VRPPSGCRTPQSIIGGVAGIFVAAVWLVLSSLFAGKILSSQHVSEFARVPFFGVWPDAAEKKRPFAFVDRWVNRLTKTATDNKQLVCANAVASAQGYSKILLCGGADAERIRNVASELETACASVQIIAAGSLSCDAEAVYGLMNCDAVILVEEIYQSDIDTVQDLVSRAKGMNKPILGVVIV